MRAPKWKKVQHHMVGHGEMAWVGESTIRRDGHRMFVELTVYTVSKMSDVSDEVSLEPDSAQVSSVRLGVEGECVVVVRMDWWRGERQGQAVRPSCFALV